MQLQKEESIALLVVGAILIVSLSLISLEINTTSIQSMNFQLSHDSDEGFEGPTVLPEGAGYTAASRRDNQSVVADWRFHFPLDSIQYYNNLSYYLDSSFALDSLDYVWEENLSIVIHPANYSKSWDTSIVSGQPGPAPLLTDDFNITYGSPLDQRQRVEILWQYNLTAPEKNLTNFFCSINLHLTLRQESGGFGVFEARILSAVIIIGCSLPTAEIIRRNVRRNSKASNSQIHMA